MVKPDSFACRDFGANLTMKTEYIVRHDGVLGRSRGVPGTEPATDDRYVPRVRPEKRVLHPTQLQV